MSNIVAYFSHPYYPGYAIWKYRGDEMDTCIFHTSVWFIPGDLEYMNNNFNF